MLPLSTKKRIPVTVVCVRFSKGEVSLQVNGLFNSNGLPGMGLVKEEGCQGTDMMFPFIFSFLDKATGYSEDDELTKVYEL